MAAAALREQLNNLLSSMFASGLVDDQFQQLQMLQEDGGTPGFVAEVVTLFCDDADRIISELAALLEQPIVDFDKVDAYVHQLKGSSASVGAQKVKFTCMQFRQLCQDKNRDGQSCLAWYYLQLVPILQSLKGVPSAVGSRTTGSGEGKIASSHPCTNVQRLGA